MTLMGPLGVGHTDNEDKDNDKDDDEDDVEDNVEDKLLIVSLATDHSVLLLLLQPLTSSNMEGEEAA